MVNRICTTCNVRVVTSQKYYCNPCKRDYNEVRRLNMTPEQRRKYIQSYKEYNLAQRELRYPGVAKKIILEAIEAGYY